MTKNELQKKIEGWTPFSTTEEYIAYLKQLAQDHRNGGMPATAEDYEVMWALLNDIWANCTIRAAGSQ